MTIAATQPRRSVGAPRRLVAALAATLLAVLAPAGATVRADEAAEREAELKAGYLYNFAKFVEWPADAPPTLTFCFDGGESVYAMLTAGLDEKRIGDRPLLARALRDDDTHEGCDVLYIDARSGSAHRGPIADDDRVLTVSDLPGFSRETGIIELYQESNRLRFAINVANARRAGMRISSDLLQLATLVDGEQAP